jgi:hypothetical protein
MEIYEVSLAAYFAEYLLIILKSDIEMPFGGHKEGDGP